MEEVAFDVELEWSDVEWSGRAVQRGGVQIRQSVFGSSLVNSMDLNEFTKFYYH